MAALTDQDIYAMLKDVVDPELGVNVVDLGLVYDVANDDGHISVEMTLTTPGCPLHDTIAKAVEERLRRHPAVRSVDVSIVWDPPWHPDLMSDEARKRLGIGE